MGYALSGYERGVERFCEQLARVGLGVWSGARPSGDAAAVYRRHRDLFSREAIAGLRDRVAAGERADAERPRRLLEFALNERANARRLPFDARLALTMRSAPVPSGGRRISLGSVPAALAREDDPAARRRLEAERSRVLAAEVDPDLIAARGEALAAVCEAGYGSLAEAFAAGAGFGLEGVAAVCRRLLDSTAAALAEGLPLLARHAGLGAPSELTIADFPRLLAAGLTDEAGGRVAEEPAAALARLCAGLGLPAPGRTGIEVDSRERAGKSERGFCVAVRVPGEVHLVVDPAAPGGREVLLHEAGHALHRAFTDRALDVGARRLGDNGVTESWAFLLEGAGGEQSADAAAEAARVRRLLLVRRHCARLIYELELDRSWESGRGAMAERYVALLSEATGVRWSSGGWLVDLDPGFYSARYVRGWMLAAEWRLHLVDRFGPGWPRSPQAGAWLRGMWSRGQALDAAVLCVAALGRDLGPAALERELAPLSAPAASRSRR